MDFIPYKVNECLENTFYQVPKELFINPYYEKLNSDSKLLYALLLDRLSVSMKNEWIDEDGNIFLIFSRKEAGEKLNLSDKTVTKAFRELNNVKLIYEKRVGLQLLQTIPGISQVSAEIILAEIGTNMNVFPTKNHLSSWAGICPGNYESAGKKKNARTTKRGSKTLKGTLCECAFSAIKSKNSFFAKLYGKFTKRQGKTKAMISVANNLLQVIYIVLKNKTPYVEMELTINEKQNQKRIKKMFDHLEKDGYIITKNSPLKVE